MVAPMSDESFERVWNEWHLELCSTADLVIHVLEQFDSLDAPDWVLAASAICRDRLRDQSYGAPVPPWKDLA